MPYGPGFSTSHKIENPLRKFQTLVLQGNIHLRTAHNSNSSQKCWQEQDEVPVANGLHKNKYGKFMEMYGSSAKTTFVLTPFGSRFLGLRIVRARATPRSPLSTAKMYTYTPIILNTVYIFLIRHCKHLLVVVYKFLSRTYAPAPIRLRRNASCSLGGTACRTLLV